MVVRPRYRGRRERGATLVEAVFSSSLTAIVILVAISIFLVGSYNWLVGQAHINAESASEMAVQQVETEVREAISVVVDSDGQGLTFELPATNPDGTYEVPLIWDGVTRRIALVQNQILLTDDAGDSAVLCDGVSPVDPLSPGGTSPYTIFTPGGGQTTRSLTIMIATTRSDSRSPILSRSRETVFLRNVPELIQ